MSQADSYLFLVVVVVIGYLLLIRPARNRAKQARQLQSALTPGDEVMLNSGIFATVIEIDDQTVRVEVAPGVILRVHRQAVTRIVVDQPPDAAADASPFAADDPSARPPDDTGGEAGGPDESSDQSRGVN